MGVVAQGGVGDRPVEPEGLLGGADEDERVLLGELGDEPVADVALQAAIGDTLRNAASEALLRITCTPSAGPLASSRRS